MTACPFAQPNVLKRALALTTKTNLLDLILSYLPADSWGNGGCTDYTSCPTRGTCCTPSLQ